jgi:photoactive yellow protein
MTGDLAVADTTSDIDLTPKSITTRAGFDSPDLFAWLEQASARDLDALPFGLITMNPDGVVTHYNLHESNSSGLTPKRVTGRNFFTQVGPCTNNAMVADRFFREPALDAVIDYSFTFRMAPRRVRLRLLRQPDGKRMYLALRDRDTGDNA